MCIIKLLSNTALWWTTPLYFLIKNMFSFLKMFETGLSYLRLFSLCTAKADLELLVALLQHQYAEITGMHHRVYLALGTETRASCMLGKHSLN